MLSQVLFATYSGLASGMAVFLVAAGLTWVFGILHILNMAHGNFAMIGAYVASSIVGRKADSIFSYIGSSLAAAIVVGALGYITERVLLRRLGKIDHHYTLIGTFALMIFLEGIVKLIWGAEVSSVGPPPGLSGSVQILGVMVPRLTIFIIFTGLLLFVVLDLVITRTWVGKVMQALASDSWMSGMLGINVPTLLAVSVVASFVLAGLAGGLLLPLGTLDPGMGGSYLLRAFFAVIIGGLGSIRGAFVASILLSLIDDYNLLIFPNFPGLAFYVALAVFLVGWPNGLFQPVGRSR
jgi:branched-chain amino acid transport system permease protein